jgi:hypothetical protein
MCERAHKRRRGVLAQYQVPSVPEFFIAVRRTLFVGRAADLIPHRSAGAGPPSNAEAAIVPVVG